MEVSFCKYFKILFRIFEYLILLVILINSVCLALYDYTDRQSETSWNKTIDEMNFVFTIIFAIEGGLKILAYGFIMHKTAYLRNIWNVMDFIIVICGIIEASLVSNSSELRTLKTVRVLRPLKTINTLPGLKKHGVILINALPNFFNVAIFLIFIFILLSILGMHQYGEGFYNRCRYNA